MLLGFVGDQRMKRYQQQAGKHPQEERQAHR
jgi:hypothetical protein